MLLPKKYQSYLPRKESWQNPPLMGFTPFYDMPMNKETDFCFYYEIISEKSPRKKTTKINFFKGLIQFWITWLSWNYTCIKNFKNRLLPWRNWLARSTVNRKVGGSSPPGSELFYCEVQFRKPIAICWGYLAGTLYHPTSTLYHHGNSTAAYYLSSLLHLLPLKRRSRVGLNHQPFD